MTAEQLEQTVIAYKHRKPFVPFIVEMMDGKTIVVDRPALAIDHGGATFIDSDDNFVVIDWKEVRDIRLSSRDNLMTAEQLEQTVIAYKHRKPFLPFVVEMMDGRTIVVETSNLAVGGGGAIFFDTEGNFVEFNCEDVRAIREAHAETAS